MKKRSLKLLACAAVLTMAFSLCACSPSKDKDDDKKTEQSNDKKDDKKDNNSDSDSDKQFATVEEYVNSPEVQSQLNSMKSTMTDDSMSVDISATEDTLTYIFKYTSTAKQDGMAETLESGVEAQKATFQATADSLKLLTDAKNPKVVIQYVDMNDEVIYSTEFAAE